MSDSPVVPGPSAPTNLTRGFVTVTAAVVVGNVFAYLLLLVAARVLGSKDYVGLVALLNLLLVGSVPAFAVQAVTARRVAIGETRDLVRVTTTLAVGGGLLFLVLTPFEVHFLHLPSAWAAAMLALCLPGITLQGMCQGVWQGRQNFSGLARTTLLGLVGRSGLALVGLAVGGTAFTTMLALTVGVSASAAVSLLTLPQPEPADGLGGSRAPIPSAAALPLPPEPSTPSGSSSLLAECAHAAHAYGAFLTLSVADLLLASHVLTSRTAAVYAAGSVMTKAALWLPQSAASVLFASMTDHTRHRQLFLRSASGLAGLGALLVAGCAVAGELVTKLVAGNRYPELHSDLWLFAALGSSLALLQFTLVTGLAIRDGRPTAIVWLTIVAEVGYVLLVDPHGTVYSIVAGVLAINAVAAAVALLQRSLARPALRRRTGDVVLSTD